MLSKNIIITATESVIITANSLLIWMSNKNKNKTNIYTNNSINISLFYNSYASIRDNICITTNSINDDIINREHILPFSSNAAAINPANIVKPIMMDKMMRMMLVIMILIILMLDKLLLLVLFYLMNQVNHILDNQYVILLVFYQI